MYKVRRRGIAARVGIIIVAIGAIAAIAVPGAGAATATPSSHAAASVTSTSGHTTCVPNGVGTTCTGTYSGDNAYDPWLDTWDGLSGATAHSSDGGQISHPPVLTVSQTKDLTDQSVTVKWQYFTPSFGNNQAPNPATAPQYYHVQIYECKGTNPTVNQTQALADSCNSLEVGNPAADASHGTPNAVLHGVTYALDAVGAGIDAPQSKGWIGAASQNTGGNPADWVGQAQIHLEVGAEDSALDCGPKVPCSLVIIPNFGGEAIRGDYTTTSGCENHDNDHPGFTSEALDSWACEYNDRIVVPLSFAKTANDCPQGSPQFNAAGSPMMSRQMTQWVIGWCNLPSPVTPVFTSLPEDNARNQFLQGSQQFAAPTDMALVTLPPDAPATQASSRKFTYAPLANSGAAMTYAINDGNRALTPGAAGGRPLQREVLDPRLVAKLTTESYALGYGCTLPTAPPWPPLKNPKGGWNASNTCDPAVAGNPVSLFDDPEFQALNKNCQPLFEAANFPCGASDFPSDSNTNQGIFLPAVLGPPDDLTYQLTNWVGADADAAGFLAGKPDLWGMSLNTNYKNKIFYPSPVFEQLDPGTQYPLPLTCPNGNCGGAEGAQDATMQNAWVFGDNLSDIATNLVDLQPSALSPYKSCPSTVNNGTCTSPFQLTFSALPQEIPNQQDLSSVLDLGDVAAYQFSAAALVNGAGNAVAPTQASVEAAVKDMKTNPDGITQYANESSNDPAAYPLAMVDYAMVPTCGLSSSKASAIANFLDKVATTGQTQGVAPGDLSPGYYPLTSAQRAATLKAAQDVKSQDCKSAPPDNTVNGHSGVNDTTPTHNGTNGTNGSGAGAGGGKSASGNKSSSLPGSPTGGTPPENARTAAFGQKSADSGLAGILLLIAIIVGALALVGGPMAWVLTATGKWPVVLRWVQPVLTRLIAARTWLTGLLPTGRA